MFPAFLDRLNIPNKRKLIFSYGALTSKACLLKSCNINLNTKKFIVYDGSFLASLMFSVSIPVVMVRTFQLPNLRVGLFLRLSDDLFLTYFSLLQLIPMHPLRKVNCGGTTPYWLRAAQLKAGGGCSLECKDSSYRRKRPLAAILSLSKVRLITGNCRFPCCIFAKNLRN